MILSNTQIAVVEQQTGAKPVPADDPVNTQLQEAFGDHTFYADPNGLHVIEALPEEMEGVQPGMAAIVQIAEWSDEQQSSLQAVEPRALGSVINLDGDAPANDVGPAAEPDA